MADVDPRLLIAATPELLDGWIGPVRVPMNAPPHTIYWCAIWTGARAIDGDALEDVPGNVLLDLSRAECRDRVARVLAAPAIGLHPGALMPEWTADEDGWCMVVGDLRAEVGQMLVWDRQGRPAGAARVAATALATLNPADDTRLPDGSRLVDALALAAVWRAVEVSRE